MRKISALTLGLAVALGLRGGPAAAQEEAARLPFDSVSLEGLDAFRSPADGWRIAGRVWADRARPLHLAAEPGTGVLVNLPRAGRGSNLTTAWEHGDLELEVEVLMPRDGNSGIFLQGRYELQLRDSWGERSPTFEDMAGIYQRWDESRPGGREGYQGHPPRLNASRAPGLWQSFRILFRAPRFDERGTKTANARLVRVVHNGVVVHENVELTGPTRGALFPGEAAAGPLVLQGDHGPVAFRNLRYKRYTGERLRVSGLRYRAYEGQFASVEEAVSGAPTREGTAEGIASAVAGAEDRFAVAYDGTLSVPASGLYRFDLGFDWVTPDPGFQGRSVGGGRLTVGGREVLLHGGLEPDASGAVRLEAGEHPFSLVFYKNRPWTSLSGVSLWAEGPGVERHALHDVGATPLQLPEPITVQPGTEPVVLRSFVEHDGATRTHAVSVGDPAGVHYGYDLAAAALLHAWRGPFVDATEMWHSRGERQLALAIGSLLPLGAAPALAFLPDPSRPWPAGLDAGAGDRFHGYALDEAGRPTFRYRVGAVEVEERIRPAGDGASLSRELVLRAPDGTDGLYARVAAGERVRRLPDGSYAVGDLEHYVVLGRGAPRPVLREQDGGQELLVPIRFRGGAARLQYTITW